jgi:hypothetical protein
MNIDWDTIASEEDSRIINTARQTLAQMEQADRPEKDGGAGGFLCYFATYKDLNAVYHFSAHGDKHTIIGLLRQAVSQLEAETFGKAGASS